MKKLSLNAAAFQKGEVLTRGQLKKIKGGDSSGSGGQCTVTYTTPTNSTPQTIPYSVAGSCTNQSDRMRSLCVDNITVGFFVTCKFDCGCDGWGS